MSNNFKVIQANNPAHADLLGSMHNLRYEVFYKELQWSVGLRIVSNMEFDEYDRLDTYYIMHLDENGEVDATCRLLPTSKPYMIADHYSDFVTHGSLPTSEKVWEISRFCASEKVRKSSNGKISGQLVAAAIEFGLMHDIESYIALVTDNIVPYMRRFVGWDPKPLGECMDTPNDRAYSISYTVSEEMLQQVRLRNGIHNHLLPDTMMPTKVNFPIYQDNYIPALAA